MKKEFELYLIKQGYKQTTPSGNPSTVYSYLKRIDNVCLWENTDWQSLAHNIGNIVKLYDNGGMKAELGNKSHRTVINALKRFAAFINKGFDSKRN